MASAVPMLEKPIEGFVFIDLPQIRDNLRAGLTVGFVSVPLSISLGVVSHELSARQRSGVRGSEDT
jgi:MFS superfamily sulfate permease-like transporter